MKLSSHFLLVTTPLLLSSVTHAWNVGRCSPFYSTSLMRPTILVSPPTGLFRYQQEVQKKMEQMNRANRGFVQTSPRYEITDSDEMFQVAVDVPGMVGKDISISVEDDYYGQKVLSIKGSRESGSETYRFTSKFAQSFSIDPTVDVDKFSASLNNGVLVVSAPKDLKRIEDNIRTIPITELSASVTDESKVEVKSTDEEVTKDTTTESKDDAKVENKEDTETIDLDKDEARG